MPLSRTRMRDPATSGRAVPAERDEAISAPVHVPHRAPEGPEDVLQIQRNAGNAATAALIARQPVTPDVVAGPVPPTREDVVSAVAAAEAALKAESVQTAWAALAKTAKERIRRLQQLINDYQHTELYGQVESKGVGGGMAKQMKDDLVDAVPGFCGEACPAALRRR